MRIVTFFGWSRTDIDECPIAELDWWDSFTPGGEP